MLYESLYIPILIVPAMEATYRSQWSDPQLHAGANVVEMIQMNLPLTADYRCLRPDDLAKLCKELIQSFSGTEEGHTPKFVGVDSDFCDLSQARR